MYDTISYSSYLRNHHWRELKFEYLKPGSRSWISGRRTHLCLHHVNYNLYRERLNRDIFRVTMDEHMQCHYILFGLIKLPLHSWILRKRIQYLRLAYCLSHKKLEATLYAIAEFMFV